MVRVLIMITVAGFILSVGALAAAFAIGGPDAIARGGWHLADGHAWRGKHLGWDDDDRGPGEFGDPGPETTRTLAWTGANRLDIDLSADVRYIQSTGPASVVVTGPQKLVERVVVEGDSVRYEHGFHRRHSRNQTLSIIVRAPAISSFDLSGRNTLAIEGYRQPSLRLDVSGRSEVTAMGQTDSVDL
uniref:GIN domain-containing protein n=1 Tax=Phenylobacterium sp. TaxID=1871053 RepID=UPI00286E71AE